MTSLLSASSLSQLLSEEPPSPPRPNCQGEAKQGRKEKQGTEQSGWYGVTSQLPQFLSGQKPSSKAWQGSGGGGVGGGGILTILGTLFCTQCKGMASDLPFNHSRVSLAKSLPGRDGGGQENACLPSLAQ